MNEDSHLEADYEDRMSMDSLVEEFGEIVDDYGEVCEICDEPGDTCEMFPPDQGPNEWILVHYYCGKKIGLELI